MVSRIYMKQKLDPPIGRDLPPVAGRIMWARQLYSRIQGPMELFQQVILTIFHLVNGKIVSAFSFQVMFVCLYVLPWLASRSSFHTRGKKNHQEL